MSETVFTAPDGRARCWWCRGDALYLDYHDEEWGRPSADERYLFEKICLEGFQAGLSWLTILRKREAFRRGFAGFDAEAVARFTEADVERLLADPGIVRHRAKIVSAINNARRCLDLRAEFGSLGAFAWRFVPDDADRPGRFDRDGLLKVTQTASSRALSKELKRRGWSFVGPTTLYAFMQAVGLVNDHAQGCASRAACAEARARFVPPAGA
ncbi:DNA-3-methyladenine glycosylase I [Marinivivus vitaminiproducens]|uniref:DNA-3-methyladenine glycosylase I n=1 Tax=Marinivivus vitaminiproducens TaxID=3035935 RepID=UPI00279C3537|nr:DNA-3-methyladenine glycosylase I [Geminicoccaceae bacterium SCSIO 64248]